ncbi:MAG TPA: hypothetical protein VE978_05720 [Chitinophagales bacterium]|nr:hypothetical protein [Chitinophagales bacterium]
MPYIFRNISFSSLIILSLLPLVSYGQTVTQDVLYLRDSSVIRGTIINQSVDSVIKIQIIGGSVLVINKTSVLNIFHQPVLEYAITPFQQEEKGYSNYTELGVMIGQEGGILLETVNGYRFKKYFFTGAGIGVDLMNVAVLSIFANGRWEMLNKRATPYLYVNAGYGFPIYHNPDHYYHEVKYHGGITYSGGAGMRFKFYGDGAFLVSAGYKNGRLYSDYFSEPEYTYKQLTIALGVSF